MDACYRRETLNVRLNECATGRAITWARHVAKTFDELADIAHSLSCCERDRPVVFVQMVLLLS